MSTRHPARWLETMATTLVPPACREHVLGDLAECSATNRQYLRHLLTVLPSVIGSQIRRRVTIGGVMIGAFINAFAFLIPQGFPKAPFFAEPWAVPRLAVPWALWVIGSTLAAAYGPADKPASWHRGILGTTLAVAVAAAWTLGVPPALVALSMAIVIALSLVLSMPWLQNASPGPLTVNTIAAHAHLFQRSIWWRNARESAACVFVIAYNVMELTKPGDPLERSAHVLLCLGALFIMGYLHLRAASKTVPSGSSPSDTIRFHQMELTRQRDILLRVPVWYLLPFVPGLAMQIAAQSTTTGVAVLAGLPVLALIFFGVWKLNLFAARFLDTKLTELQALQRQS